MHACHLPMTGILPVSGLQEAERYETLVIVGMKTEERTTERPGHPGNIIERQSIHLEALTQGSIDSVKLPLDERLLDRHHGSLDVIVEANNELQVANLGSEGLSSLVHLCRAL